MRILVTGAAGFIGYHICKKLLDHEIEIIGIDNLNKYYDPLLKERRLKELQKFFKIKSNKSKIYNIDIENTRDVANIFKEHQPKVVINLAAQAGVRYSLENPNIYLSSNIVGFGNILENCRLNSVEHLLFASSSSVYGSNNQLPYKEDQRVDHPVSIYAASKRSNELMAYSYSHLYNLKCTGMRFFTVYGPWGRPDMALYKFTEAIINQKEIKIFNKGELRRDFTYIDDVTESIYRLIYKPPTKELSNSAPFNIFNIGNSSSIKLLDFIEIIESQLNLKAKKVFEEMQLGDVYSTYADCSKIEQWINFKPKTDLRKGIQIFIDWYKQYNLK